MRRRPRLCRTCHAPASWAVESVLPTATIKRDGRVLRGWRAENVYYCDAHIDAAEAAPA